MSDPLRRCTHPGCRLMAVPGKGRCEKHEQAKQASSTKNRSGDPFYKSAAWIVVRNARRALDPLCVMCLELGKVTPMWAADHILPRDTHPHLELDLDNTRSLCESHHNSRTRRDNNAKGRQ